MRTRLFTLLSPLVYLASNALSLLGVVLVTTGGVSWFFLLPTLLRGESQNPYLGLLWVADLAVFLIGLGLIPVGIHFRRRRLQKQGIVESKFPVLDFSSPELKRVLGFVLVTTFANVLIAGQLTYKAVSYMETDKFCGQVCHSVMSPELTAYEQSPHAHVACVECHIGPGVVSFVKAKVNGSKQVLMLATHGYPTPIPAPVENMRPAADTCEHCHTPGRMIGNRVLVHTEYAEDEGNTPATTVLTMKIGGRTANGGTGIHGAHTAVGSKIEYVTTDAKRQTIPQVIYTAADGTQTVYNATDSKVKPEELARGERRRMDCMDCHNRPGHNFELAGRALDSAMSSGTIATNLPFVRKQAMAALNKPYADRETAAREIASSMGGYYQATYPQVAAQNKAQLDGAIAAVQAIYAHNIFPEMKITWGTYVNNLGHMDSPGCFRCHDGSHTSASGKTIASDCSTCHDMVAMQEKNPKILMDLGMAPAAAAAPAAGGAGH
ncbi:MAG TPA: NapC/NirT family cytochrome c [Bryobacteraceae bacterium]|jgi:nitrate/TMAO reductase-like tetraheme cytochrome c subunit